MCIFRRRYSASESEQKLAAAIVFVMANNGMKNYKNLIEFCRKSPTAEGINPKSIKFKRMIITKDIQDVLKRWKFLGYKCSNENLQKGIDLLINKAKLAVSAG